MMLVAVVVTLVGLTALRWLMLVRPQKFREQFSDLPQAHFGIASSQFQSSGILEPIDRHIQAPLPDLGHYALRQRRGSRVRCGTAISLDTRR